MKIVQVLTQSGLENGEGHFVRQKALQKKLNGKDISLELHLHFSSLSERLKNPSKNDSDLIILDLPKASQQFCSKLQSEGYRIFAFDWMAKDSPNYNLILVEHPFEKFPFITKKFVGLEFFMVREEVSLLINKPPSIRSPEYCLITMGGGAEVATLNDVEARISKVWSGQVIKVIGSHKGSLSEIQEKDTLQSPPDYPYLLASAALVATNGGSSLVEALCLKKKTISFPRNLHEFSFANKLKSSGAIFELDEDYARIYPKQSLINPDNTFGNMLTATGTNRVSEIIYGLI